MAATELARDLQERNKALCALLKAARYRRSTGVPRGAASFFRNTISRGGRPRLLAAAGEYRMLEFD